MTNQLILLLIVFVSFRSPLLHWDSGRTNLLYNENPRIERSNSQEGGRATGQEGGRATSQEPQRSSRYPGIGSDGIRSPGTSNQEIYEPDKMTVHFY